MTYGGMVCQRARRWPDLMRPRRLVHRAGDRRFGDLAGIVIAGAELDRRQQRQRRE
jgi:hypothetical protein